MRNSRRTSSTSGGLPSVKIAGLLEDVGAPKVMKSFYTAMHGREKKSGTALKLCHSDYSVRRMQAYFGAVVAKLDVGF